MSFCEVAHSQAIYMSNFNKPVEYIWIKVENHFKGHYESEHLLDVENFKQKFIECNKTSKIVKLMRNGFLKHCKDKSFFSLWGGFGSIEMTNTTSDGRAQIISAESFFIGGQTIFTWSMQTLIILEGKYWYLPIFSVAGESAGKKLRVSSYMEGMAFMQQRISYTPFSIRVGLVGLKVPVVRDNNSSVFSTGTDFRFNSAIVGGVLLGLKFQPNRSTVARHSVISDIVTIAYEDNRLMKHFASKFLFKLGYKWLFHRNLTLTAEFESLGFFRKSGEEVDSTLYGVGLQAFIF